MRVFNPRVGRLRIAARDPYGLRMIHLMKLAVGIRDVAHLGSVQAERIESTPPLRHKTRSFPRRAAEITDGGSLFWVIGGAMLVRQRILDVIEDRWDDDRKCAGLVLHPALVPVEGRPVRAFQGWRYLEQASAPRDIQDREGAEGADGLPPLLRRQLRELCLL